MSTVRINDGNGYYICEYGHLHDYGKINFDERIFDNVEELKNALEE